MKKRSLEWLYFTRGERISAAMLLFLCVIVLLVPDWLRQKHNPPPTDFSELQAQIAFFRSDSAILNTSDPAFTGKFPKDTAAARAVAAPFPFDPNTASEADLLRLGLPKSAVRGIIAYRKYGAVFRKREDVQKIYALSETDYRRVEPYIELPDAKTLAAQKQEQAPRPATYSGGGAESGGPVFEGQLDINRAPLEMWQQLPGIGEKRARQIVNFREKLGGFVSIEQVAEVRGLPDSIFQKIRPYLVPNNESIRKMNLNAVTIDDLTAHPYCSEKQASMLVLYRQENGYFKSVNDLQHIGAFSNDPKWLARIKPYLDVK
jgi:competence protein ComEA